MILLLLTTLALASDVYEICVMKHQIWSDESQTFYTKSVRSFYAHETIQLIIHDNSFEINRKEKNIKSRVKVGKMPCFVEHENSFVCFDKPNNQFLWEFYYRSGKVTRDVMQICRKNGE